MDFTNTFLNRPSTNDELKVLSDQYAHLSFSVHVESIDRINYVWKSCPDQERMLYLSPHSILRTIVQGAGWCDHDRYVWHWFSERPGSNNDVNVLSHSLPFQKVFNDRLPFHIPIWFKVMPRKQKHLFFVNFRTLFTHPSHYSSNQFLTQLSQV